MREILNRIRFKLIKILVGRDPVVMNVKVFGTIWVVSGMGFMSRVQFRRYSDPSKPCPDDAGLFIGNGIMDIDEGVTFGDFGNYRLTYGPLQ